MAAGIISGDGQLSDVVRRQRLYEGEIFFLPPRRTVAAFAEFAWELISEAFAGRDPMVAFRDLAVEDYVAILGPLKTRFTHHERSKELLEELLADLGCDVDTTYFDVPKLRVVTPASYLKAGLGYNYLPHRDTWYSAPQCQINWWMPIRGVTSGSCMAFHPDFWQREATNTSEDFDAYEWNRSSRRDAATYITSDPRPHPHLDNQNAGAEVRLVGEVGSLICFSGAQLHSTVPNEQDHTRFSIDFRTVSIDDVSALAGPPNVDSRSTGTTLWDFINADTHEQLPKDLIALYDHDGSAEGVKVFDPSVLG